MGFAGAPPQLETQNKHMKHVLRWCAALVALALALPAQAVEATKISDVAHSVFFRGGSGTRGAAGTNGGHASDRYFNGDFTDYTYCNGNGTTELVIPTTGLDDQGTDTGVAWYVTDFKVGHQGNAQYSLYYTTDPEPEWEYNENGTIKAASDPRTWTLIAGADHVQEAGTKTFGVNAFATAVKYVFNTCPNWTTHLAEVEVWAMDPSSITCLHPNMTDDSPAWTVCTAPTCTENGFEERFCPDCGARFEREVPLSKLGHDFVATLTTPGSASSYGSGYVECSRCNEFHIEFNGDTVDLTTLGGPPINGVVQYTDLTVSSTGAEDGGVKPIYLMDGDWSDGWGHAWYAGTRSHDEYVQFAFGTTIELTKIEYSVLNQYQTVDFYKYDPDTEEETLLKTIPIVKDETEGAPGYQRKTVYFFGGGETDSVQVDAIRMRIGDYVDPVTGATTAYIGYNYGRPYHTIVCEIHPHGTIAGAGMSQPAAMIGNVGYETLAEAVAAVAEGAESTTTITLQMDLDLTGTENNVVIPSGKDVTLDLNGCAVAADVDGDLLVQGALTLVDSLGSGKLHAVSPTGSRGIVRVEGGTFTMAGGAIESVPDPADPGNAGSYAVVYRANSTVNVTGGTITAGWFCLSGNGNDKTGKESTVTISGGTLLSTADYAVYFPNAGTLSISGTAKISGAAGALAANNGTIDITGGTFLSSGTGDIQPGTDGTSGLGDVAVNIVGKYGETTATISGGTFTAAEQAVVLAAGANGASLAVSGGTFSQAVPAEYCAEGFVPYEQTKTQTVTDPETGAETQVEVGTGVYGVKPAWTVTFVNEKGEAPAAQVLDVVEGQDLFATEPDSTPAAEGFTFLGWFAEGAEAPFDFANTPITGDLTLTAAWEEIVAALDPVDVGAGLAGWDWGAEDPKAPMEVVPADGADPESLVVRFVGKAGVTYQLVGSATLSLDEDGWLAAKPAGEAVTPDADGIVELVAPMDAAVQFFKIKASK